MEEEKDVKKEEAANSSIAEEEKEGDVKKEGQEAEDSSALAEKGEDKLPETVPYSRLKEATEARRLAEEKARGLEQELQLRRQQEIVAERSREKKPQVTDEEWEQRFLENPAKAMKDYVASQREALLPEVEEAIARRIATERVREGVINDYPDIKNPNTEFAREVADFMFVRPHLYKDPEGLRLAADSIALKLNKSKIRDQVRREDETRKQTGAQAAGIEGKGKTTPPAETAELDNEGKRFASKFGISEKAMAERLKARLEQKQSGGR